MKHDSAVAMLPFRFYLITDLTLVSEGEHCTRLKTILENVPQGRVAVGLRDSSFSLARRLNFGQQILKMTREFSAPLIVHDRLDLAMALEAEGVQLGVNSLSVSHARTLLGKEKWIGCSCHNDDEIRHVQSHQPDWIMLSPVFASPGKGTPLGVHQWAHLRNRAASIPFIALGGMTQDNANHVYQAGADVIGGIRLWLDAQDGDLSMNRILKSLV